jgi:hypothetical protein
MGARAHKSRNTHMADGSLCAVVIVPIKIFVSAFALAAA